MRPLSLRGRLVLGTVGLLALGLLVANLAVLGLFRGFQIRQVDEQLQSPFGGEPPAELRLWLDQACDLKTGLIRQIPTDFAMVIVDEDGRVTCRIPDSGDALAGSDLELQQLAPAATSGGPINLPADHGPPRWRARVVAMDEGYVVFGRSLVDSYEAFGRLGTIALTVSAIILGVAAAAGFAVVRIGLLPLTRIQRTAERIAEGDLSRRIDVASSRTEVGRLGTSLNTMLAQIEDAFAQRTRTEERLRRFVADASHELRTPLATIRGHAELGRSGIAATPAEISRVLSRIEAESIRMGALVDDLLLLARLDTTRALEQRPVDLLSIAVDAVADTHARAPQRRVAILNPTDPPWQDRAPTVLGDQARLQQIVTNLLSNAVQHTPEGTAVEVQVGVRDEAAVLEVIDHGPGLQTGNEERVFERFFREDPGRGRSHGGSGLGLAIAWTLTEKHGGELDYRPTPGGGSTFRLTLPATL
ncbi:sensor histidine kinase [Tessaracoccus caeni]|uniref:sensor histidine kinase n=1 Tax=Tessaracoccus caeni TaxID=3031239 RepID=UPI0023DB1812|nr:HAMP domain-containing sensor histidine kinase [Tessaracoccus caeni]MDF1489201.1 HAMP domain-containing sensor histidine kinase [Tessaracoccus caeni]